MVKVDFYEVKLTRREISITDKMIDKVRNVKKQNVTANDVAGWYNDDDGEVQEIVWEEVSKSNLGDETFPSWALDLGLSDRDWNAYWEAQQLMQELRIDTAIKKADLDHSYARKYYEIQREEDREKPILHPTSKLIKELTNLIYANLTPEQIQELDEKLAHLKAGIRDSRASSSTARQGAVRNLIAEDKPEDQFIEDVASIKVSGS
jgi:hypothetical protein